MACRGRITVASGRVNDRRSIENFVRQIVGANLTGGESTTLEESIEQQKHREQLEKQIAALEAKMKKEKQLNRKMELKAGLKRLRTEIAVL